jgi:hypothetical protein
MYSLTFHDGTTENLTEDDVKELEDEIQFVSYKKDYRRSDDGVSVEISSNVGHLGLKKTMAFVRQKAEYEARKAIGWE